MTSSGEEILLVVRPQGGPSVGAFLAQLLITSAGVFVGTVGGVTIEGLEIPASAGWVFACLFGLGAITSLVSGLAPRIRRTPTLTATAVGLSLRSAIGRTTGPIHWGEISRFRFHEAADGSVASLSIELMDAAATYQRLGRTWRGLATWLTGLGDPLSLVEADVDRPLEQLMWQLRDLHAAHVDSLPG